MIQTVEAIIEQLGGPDATARHLGVGTEALRKWRQARAVPAKHFASIIAATGLRLEQLPGSAPSNASIPMPDAHSVPPGATAALVFADSSVL